MLQKGVKAPQATGRSAMRVKCQAVVSFVGWVWSTLVQPHPSNFCRASQGAMEVAIGT